MQPVGEESSNDPLGRNRETVCCTVHTPQEYVAKPLRLALGVCIIQAHTQRYWDWVAVTSMRSGQPGINGNEYASFVILCPPLDEQERIAKALSDIDSMISSLENTAFSKKYLYDSPYRAL